MATPPNRCVTVGNGMQTFFFSLKKLRSERKSSLVYIFINVGSSECCVIVISW